MRNSAQRLLAAAALWLLPGLPAMAAPSACGGEALVQVQVLGSGGPQLTDGRAASGYLVWIDGHARLLVDAGGGVALRFGEAGARFEDLDAILLTNLQAGHSADLPTLLEASFFGERRRELPLYGPAGNRHMPSTVGFARALFDNARGAYRYLSGFLNPIGRSRYKLKPHDVRQPPQRLRVGHKPDALLVAVFANERLRVTAAPIAQGNVPSLAYRVEAAGKSVVFTGDSRGEDAGLVLLVRDADLLVVHHAAPQAASEAPLERLLPPSEIGRLAQNAGVRQLVLPRRTAGTLGKEEQSLSAIRHHYAGQVTFADDLGCFTP